jgi:tRNA(Ile)-lysidine synthase
LRKSISKVKPNRPLSPFARELRRAWRNLKLGGNGEAVVVAVSGGADSVALLLALNELVQAGKIDVGIIVAHLNHKLRGAASDADARWVASLAKRLGRRVEASSSDIKKRADRSGDNLEQAARRARYEFLAKVARLAQAKLILTAHTMNDQAETVLINLLRGSGTGGLGGMEPRRPLVTGSAVTLARPLLLWATRPDTEAYCRSLSIAYREDQMNFDENLTRVRVRTELLPLLESFNPKFIETAVRSAEILRADDAALDTAAQRLLEVASDPHHGRATSLHGDVLRLAPLALRRRALRLWLALMRGDLRRIEHVHIVAIEKLLESTRSGRAIELPGGAIAFRKDGMLHFQKRQKPK